MGSDVRQPDVVDAPATAGTDDAVDRAVRLMQVTAEVIRRRRAGELLPDADVIARNPDLMPDLADELDGLRALQLTLAAARKAGPIRAPLTAIPLADLDAPISVADAGGEVDDGGDAAPGSGGGEDGADPRPSVPGYLVYREVISGGQATVYKACQESTGRVVAIKVLPGGRLAGSVDRARFDREADILAALDHPNIVGIVDRGRAADGAFYLVMPYVDGRPLDLYAQACVADGAAGVQRLLMTFARLAVAVATAHARGVVHRDLKPSNILVDPGGEPHLLDFGLARLLRGCGGDWRQRTITLAGQVVGSLPWSSPEQVSGDGSADAGPASDVYALGVCLYQCLTGRHPYSLDGSIPELIDRIRYTRPAPVGRLPGVATDAVRRLLDRCLAKAPPERYPNAAALAEDLSALLAGRPLAYRPWDSWIVRLRARARRRRRALIVAAAAAITLGGAGAVAYLYWPPPRPTPVASQFRVGRAINSIGMSLRQLPAGRFVMGTHPAAAPRGADEPQREVEITRPFWIGVHEVTRAEYALVMELPAPPAGSEQLPVRGVSWDDATMFCRRLSDREPGRGAYRLPTEAEWEYACRAGGGAGAVNGSGVLDDVAWHAGNAGGGPHRVGSRDANHWGLHDMIGNAAEWCLDDYAPAGSPHPTDPVARDPAAPRVVRGGSVASPAADARSAARRAVPRNAAPADVGFRVVRDLPADPAAATRPATR